MALIGILPHLNTQNPPETILELQMPMIQGNSFLPISSVYYPDIQVLASKIAECESYDNPTAKNPNSTAYGRCQFIDRTWLYVQDKWKMKLDRHDSNDQMYACERLLREEGTKHWIETQDCWSK